MRDAAAMVLREIFGTALAVMLGLLPIASLVWGVLAPDGAADSAFTVAFYIVVGFAAVLVYVARQFSKRNLRWSHVANFCFAAIALQVSAAMLFPFVAIALNATDSSHGGSFMDLVMANLGIAIGATVWLARRTRLAK